MTVVVCRGCFNPFSARSWIRAFSLLYAHQAVCAELRRLDQ